MITLSDNIYASLPLPGDAKNINIIMDGGNIIVETILQYLYRVDMLSRYLGMEVSILTPEGIYEANEFITRVNTQVITWQKYGFIDGIEDINFVPIIGQDLVTEEYYPVTIADDSTDILHISEFQELGITLPQTHSPVTIADDSTDILHISEFQELGITLPTILEGHLPVSIADNSKDMLSITEDQELSINKILPSDIKTYVPDVYGHYYNYYAAVDSRNIASAGWHMPSDAEWAILANDMHINWYKLVEAGITHWNAPNIGTNELGFSIVGAGDRDTAGFKDLHRGSTFWTSTDSGYIEAGVHYAWSYSTYPIYAMGQRIRSGFSAGYSIRLICDSSVDPGYYQGNDGTYYSTIVIGSQVWMLQNLRETKYRNNDLISGPTYTNAAWSGLSTEAYCRYEIPLLDQITKNHNDLKGIQGGSNDLGEFYHLTTTQIANLHNPVTIATTDLASIDINQVLTINPLTTTDGKTYDVNGYGALYNWYAATDSRNLAASGWRLPTNAEALSFISSLGTQAQAADILMEVGTVHWAPPNSTATNSSKFNGVGGGFRGWSWGNWQTVSYNWTSVDTSSYFAYVMAFSVGQALTFSNQKYFGNSIRFVKNSTSLLNGQSGTYTGNDGKVYRTICIGTQEWLADNLNETKYRNGDWIHGFDGGVYTPIINDDWQSLDIEAMCYHNDDEVSGGSPTLHKTPVTGTLEVIKEHNLLDGLNVDNYQHLTTTELGKVQALGTISSKDFWSGTLAAYDAIVTKDSNTIYFIEE